MKYIFQISKIRDIFAKIIQSSTYIKVEWLCEDKSESGDFLGIFPSAPSSAANSPASSTPASSAT